MQTNYAYPSKYLKKQVDYTYSLTNTNQWCKFPELNAQISLSEPTSVSIGYTITLQSNEDSHLCTKVLVNGAERKQFRAISGNTKYHTNHVTNFVPLTNGTHKIQVWYRTPANIQNQNLGDWNFSSLVILY